ncbi:MAG: hypothetical protein N2560_06270 [Ignavibacteria bacterium]|nr:hypothetical protein [Ignavibacteria bacterium]
MIVKSIRIIAWVVVVLFFAFQSETEAKRNGIVNRTNTNSRSCGECHSANPNPNVVVKITSEKGTFQTTPNEIVKFILTVQSQSGSTAGCNIAVKTQQNGNVSAGRLEPYANSGLILSQRELTHQQPKPITNGTVSFEFLWQAPETPGTYFLQAVALASNNNNREDANDIWNFAPVQAIEVVSPSSVEDCNVDDIFTIPNPYTSNSVVKINYNEKFNKINSITLFLLNSGRFVQISPNLDELVTTLRGLPQGIYFLSYSIEGKTFNRSFVKLD